MILIKILTANNDAGARVGRWAWQTEWINRKRNLGGVLKMRSKRTKRAAYQGPPASHRVKRKQGNIEIEKDKSTEAKGRGDNLI